MELHKYCFSLTVTRLPYCRDDAVDVVCASGSTPIPAPHEAVLLAFTAWEARKVSGAVITTPVVEVGSRGWRAPRPHDEVLSCFLLAHDLCKNRSVSGEFAVRVMGRRSGFSWSGASYALGPQDGSGYCYLSRSTSSGHVGTLGLRDCRVHRACERRRRGRLRNALTDTNGLAQAADIIFRCILLTAVCRRSGYLRPSVRSANPGCQVRLVAG